MNTVAPLPPEVKLTMQGGLIQAQVKQHTAHAGNHQRPAIAKAGGKRGSVNAFTAAARRRLMRLFARLAPAAALFLTLTYPADYPNPRIAKRHLDTYMKRLRRKFPKLAGVWRLEFQRRGAPHFHVLLFGVDYIPMDQVQAAWGEIIGCPHVFTRIESISGSRRKVMAYVSKYVAKVGGTPQPGSEGGGGSPPDGFNTGTYLTADGWVNPKTGEIECSVGRWWGVVNAADLPFAEAFDVVLDTLTVYYQLRRGARHLWSGVGCRKYQGFTLFVDDAARWVDYFFAICAGAA